MKFNGIPGEFGFQALVYNKDTSRYTYEGFCLTSSYYFSLEEVKKSYLPTIWEIKWPVEVYDDGSVRVVSEEELDESI